MGEIIQFMLSFYKNYLNSPFVFKNLHTYKDQGTEFKFTVCDQKFCNALKMSTDKLNTNQENIFEIRKIILFKKYIFLSFLIVKTKKK